MGRIGWFAGLLFALTPGIASAQTWAAGQGPTLPELFAIDKTGETNWIYGAEDLAGDTLAIFQQQEQSIDIRTAYASTDNQRLWVRVYVSDTAAPGANVSMYVFIDSDKTASTGGSAIATPIDPKFTADSSGGGYEYVLGVRGNGQVVGVWEWTDAWTPLNLPPNRTAAEAGTFLDPIRLGGDNHGYLQGEIDLDSVGLTQACQANLYVRTTNDTTAQGDGDLEVGQIGACVPADANANNVPDVLEKPPQSCSTSAQCPNGGVCVNGTCVLSTACTTAADCGAGYTCDNGHCVVTPNGTCTTTADCTDGRVCIGGQCSACGSDADCGSGYTCGPDGRCLNPQNVGGEGGSGLVIGPDDEIRGGACACSMPGGPTARGLLAALALLPLLLIVRRRDRRTSR